MINRLKKLYFDAPPSKGLIHLYVAKTIVMSAAALLGIFLPIFLYNLFNKNFQLVVIYYGLGSLLYGLFVVFGAKILNKIGFKKALQISTLLGALFYIIFYFTNKENFLYLIPLSLVVLFLYRLFYWLPYHVDFAKFTDYKNRGREVSLFNGTRLALGIFIPAIAGIIITYLGFSVLFAIVIFIYLFSIFPYFFIPHTREKFSWTIKETGYHFFSKKKRRLIIAYFSEGAENFIEIVVWPIFIYQILKGNYLEVGTISALIIGVTVLIQLILGKVIDLRIKKERVLKWGTIFYSFGWLLKVSIVTAFQVFIIGVYHKITYIFTKTPFDSLKYEIAADEGHYVDEITILREIALNLGKASAAFFVIIISLYFGIQWTFILAAISVLFFNLLRKREWERFKALPLKR